MTSRPGDHYCSSAMVMQDALGDKALIVCACGWATLSGLYTQEAINAFGVHIMRSVLDWAVAESRQLVHHSAPGDGIEFRRHWRDVLRRPRRRVATGPAAPPRHHVNVEPREG